jgi:hypothetical protein
MSSDNTEVEVDRQVQTYSSKVSETPQFWSVKVNVFKLLGLDINTGNGVLDGVIAVSVIVVIFAGLISYRRFASPPRPAQRRPKPSKAD